jgi:hypothetical protein
LVLLLQSLLRKKLQALQKAISEGFAHQKFSNAPLIVPPRRLADKNPMLPLAPKGGFDTQFVQNLKMHKRKITGKQIAGGMESL